MSFEEYLDQCDLDNYDPVRPECIECDVVMVLVDEQPIDHTVWECPICKEQDSDV